MEATQLYPNMIGIARGIDSDATAGRCSLLEVLFNELRQSTFVLLLLFFFISVLRGRMMILFLFNSSWWRIDWISGRMAMWPRKRKTHTLKRNVFRSGIFELYLTWVQRLKEAERCRAVAVRRESDDQQSRVIDLYVARASKRVYTQYVWDRRRLD